MAERPTNIGTISFFGSMAEYVGQNGTPQQQAGESVTCGDRRRRERGARKAVAAARPPAAEEFCRLRRQLVAVVDGYKHVVKPLW